MAVMSYGHHLKNIDLKHYNDVILFYIFHLKVFNEIVVDYTLFALTRPFSTHLLIKRIRSTLLFR